MLATQLQNQDPMNPVESSDYAVQLATFSSVEQQVLTNNLLESLNQNFAASDMSGLASWVGMEARSTAPARYEGTPVTLSPNPLTAADKAMLVVRNEAGSVVYSKEVAVSADLVTWNGTSSTGSNLPHGSYSFELENYAEGELIAVDAVESYSLVTEARIVEGQTVLVTAAGDLVPSDMVTGLRQPTQGQ